MLGGNKNGNSDRLQILVTVTAITSLLNALIDLINRLSK